MLKFQTKQFDNGLKLITAPMDSTEAVTILILVKIGGRYETAKQAGISHFLEHLFFKGSKKMPTALEIAKAFDGLGANYNAFTGEEYTGFYVQSGAKDFLVALDLLSDMFLNPIFPEEEVEREKGVILEEANMRRDVPQIHVQSLIQDQVFPDSALGRELIGTPETIKAIKREDIVKYFKQNYVPSATTIVVCGNTNGVDWEKEIAAKFMAYPSGQKGDFVKFDCAVKSKRLFSEQRKIDQAHLVCAYRTFPIDDSRRYALALLSSILGGGMSSRLFTEIREKRGLAYYVKSDVSAFTDTGMISFSAGVKQDKFDEVIKLIFAETADLAANGPTEEELDRAKKNFRGKIALALEGSFEVAEFLAEEAFYEKIIRQPEDIIRKIEAVTVEQIKQLSKEIFQIENCSIAVVGPQKYTVPE